MSGWRIAFIVTHIVELVFIWALFKDYHFVDPALYDEVAKQQTNDVIRVAYQIGRLDLASMFLGGISILIALGAIFAFMEVRSRAETVAIKAAQDAVNQRVGSLFEAEMKKRNEKIAPVINLSRDQESAVLTAASEIREE